MYASVAMLSWLVCPWNCSQLFEVMSVSLATNWSVKVCMVSILRFPQAQLYFGFVCHPVFSIVYLKTKVFLFWIKVSAIDFLPGPSTDDQPDGVGCGLRREYQY